LGFDDFYAARSYDPYLGRRYPYFGNGLADPILAANRRNSF
jgi:hypothetical protein